MDLIFFKKIHTDLHSCLISSALKFIVVGEAITIPTTTTTTTSTATTTSTTTSSTAVFFIAVYRGLIAAIAVDMR